MTDIARRNDHTEQAATHEGVGTVLWNEVELLVAGTGRGLAQSAKKAAEHPWKFGAELLGSFVVGGGLALAQRGAGPLRLGAEVFGLASTASFMTNALDGQRWGTVWSAMADTARSGSNLERSKEKVARALGDLAFDTTVMTGSGLAGVGLSRKFFPRLREPAPITKLIEPTRSAAASNVTEPVVAKSSTAFAEPAAIKTSTTQVEASTVLANTDLAAVPRPDVTTPAAVSKPKFVDERFLTDLVITKLDPVSAAHSLRVKMYSNLLAETLGLPRQQLEVVNLASIGHDLGKMNVPPSILNKAGKLEPAELVVMRSHAQWSEEILSGLNFSPEMQSVPRIAAAHHELLSGRGYFRGLKGEQIAQETRIITVADIFDALTGKRPYKDGMSIEAAFELMTKQHLKAGDPDLDPAIFRAFLNIPNRKLIDIKALTDLSKM